MLSVLLVFTVRNQILKLKVSFYGEVPKFLKKLKIYQITNIINGPDLISIMKKIENLLKNIYLDKKKMFPLSRD
jgi:hypothetical protein